MTTYILLNERKVELLDKTLFFEEGETVFIESEGKRQPHKIASIIKILIDSGNGMDAHLEVQLL